MTPTTFKATTPPVRISFDAKVSSLINPLNNTWQTDVIKQVFSHAHANTILGIPLNSRRSVVRLVWAYTLKGNFTVHSAYKVALSSTSGLVLETLNTQNCKSFWKSLWRLNVPNKIKNFAWHASCNILPTKVNLCHRKVIDSPTCEACGLEDESSGHLFWHYAKIRDIWSLSSLPLDMYGVHFCNTPT